MARGQYDLPLNRARPVYGPSRPPPPQAIRPTRCPSSEGPLSTQQSRPTAIVLCASGTTLSKPQFAALRARVQPEATIQVVDTADATIAALSRKPFAVIDLDKATNHPTFDLARSAIIQYAQSGGHLITDISSSNMPTPYDPRHANERRVEYKMKESVPSLRTDHLMT